MNEIPSKKEKKKEKKKKKKKKKNDDDITKEKGKKRNNSAAKKPNTKKASKVRKRIREVQAEIAQDIFTNALELPRLEQEIKGLEPVQTIEIHVETLSGASFNVILENRINSVKSLKKAIQDKQGTRHYLQDLCLVLEAKGIEEEEKVHLSNGEALKDDATLLGPCNVIMCVRVETRIEGERIFLSGSVRSGYLSPYVFV
jgi:hypothetical protein